MIEISHHQAQRLIRERLDRSIPEDQWTLLQAHLESCASCRDYQERLVKVERDLTRSLHERWSVVNGPAHETPLQVMRGRKTKAQRRAAFSENWLLLAMLLLGGYIALRIWGPGQPRQSPAPAAGVRATAVPTPSPTPRFNFRGVVAFESNLSGNAEIYLLNVGPKGSDLSNLTNDPAADTDLAWSPDGAWIAFLSDRTGKREVYVENISGSRLTRLTDRPEIDWQGPLSWSADGRTIALTGHKKGTDHNWVYLVLLNGSGARSLAYTRDANPWLAFSPTSPLLAYASAEGGGSVVVYNLINARYYGIGWEDIQRSQMRSGIQGGFDWSADGTGLAYLADGPYQPDTQQLSGAKPLTQVKVARNMSTLMSDTYQAAPYLSVFDADGAGSLRELAWAPGDLSHWLAFLSDPDGDGCWSLLIHSAIETTHQHVEVPGLCIDGSLSQANWSPNGDWLMVLGHPRADHTAQQPPVSRLYALHLADLTDPRQAVSIQPLGSDSTLALGRAVSYGTPQVRPEGAALDIQPKAAEAWVEHPPANLPSALPGKLVYSAREGSKAAIYRADPVSTGRFEMAPAANNNSCPSQSPGGPTAGRTAFLSEWGSGTRQTREVFLTGPMGFKDIGSVTRLTQPVTESTGEGNPPQPVVYDCPVWSPDGTRLAAYAQTSRGSELAIIPATPGKTVEYYLIDRLNMNTPPVWTPDGTGVVIAVRDYYSIQAQIKLMRLLPNATQTIPWIQNNALREFSGMTFSPDGTQLAYLAISQNGDTYQKQLFIARADGKYSRLIATLPPIDPFAVQMQEKLAWLSDDRLQVVIPHRVDDLYKTDLFEVNLTQIDAESIPIMLDHPTYRLEDVVYAIAFSPDRRWMAYSSDTGLYLLDLQAAFNGTAWPYQVTDDQVFQLDWR